MTPTATNEPPVVQRIDYLDSVRGLAALAVAVFHFIGWRWEKETTFHLASFVFNGSDAVSLFFVLSGLVLSWKYFHPDTSLAIDGTHYRQYLLNRVVRLYVPFLVALLGIYYVQWYYDGHFFYFAKGFLTNANGWVEEALLVRGKHLIYQPAWTLEVEMGGSLLLPFLVLLMRHSRPLYFTLLAIGLGLGGAFIFGTLFHFMLGIVLAYYFPRIASFDVRASKLYPFCFLLYGLAFALFSVRHITRIYPLGPLANYWLGLLRLDLFHFTGFGAFLILAYVINSPRVQRALAIRPLLFLGRISYSLYLVHWFFVSEVMAHWEKLDARFIDPRVAFAVLLGATVGASLLGAYLFNILVERPAMRFGRRLGARLFAQPDPPAPTLVPAS